ncbi:hypothetical protein [Gemmata sp.]|uniref:hypothetical protein n=1 Tax=Gemmata sp. TaxID=1914242 RepID=UPI003F6F5C9E
MAEDDWLEAQSPGAIAQLLLTAPPRRLHTLTAAFLRRSWDDLPTELSRAAVEATEAHARGRIGPGELARLRAADARETRQPLWLSLVPVRRYARLIECCGECPWCEDAVSALEGQVARHGPYIGAARAGVEYPHWIAAKAALYARSVVATGAGRVGEAEVQFEVVQEVMGPSEAPARFDRAWRTGTVVALARGIEAESAFDRMPILADALQDAGCDDVHVLDHCRLAAGHTRGCWVVESILGIG